MKKKQVTIHDIAEELGITASTVSRALNDHPRISGKTKQKVQDKALEMKYHPNSLASNLRKGEGNTLGICIPRINRHFFSNVIGGIESVANEKGYNVMICQSLESYEREVANIQSLLNSRVDGIIMSLSTGTTNFDHIQMVKERDVSLIMFDRVCEELEVNKVLLDDYIGAYRAVEHLVKQGCKKIAHFGGALHLNVYRDRYEGYVNALANYGLEYNQEWVFSDTLTRDNGDEAAKNLLSMKNRPDALFAASDYAALGALLQFKDQGILVPEEMAVIGFANEPFTELVDPGLSSVEQHGAEMGQSIANMFFEDVGKAKRGFIPRKTILEPELIIRASSLKKK